MAFFTNCLTLRGIKGSALTHAELDNNFLCLDSGLSNLQNQINGISGGGSFTGNTSASCITNLYVSNVYGCSPITIHDSIVSNGSTVLDDNFSFAFGNNVIATGITSFATGYNTKAFGNYSHVEGVGTISLGDGSHAEGQVTKAFGSSSHAEGRETLSGVKTFIIDSVVNGVVTLNSIYSGVTSEFTSGIVYMDYNAYSYNPSNVTFSSTTNTEIYLDNTSLNFGGWVVDSGNLDSDFANYIIGEDTHAEGWFSVAIGTQSHAEGNQTVSLGDVSHAEGLNTLSIGYISHVEGSGSISRGDISHAEGIGSVSNGIGSHSEGGGTTTNAIYSHAEGAVTVAGAKVFTVQSISGGVITIDSSLGNVTSEFIGSTVITPIGDYVYNTVTFTSLTNTQIYLNDNTVNYVAPFLWVVDGINMNSSLADNELGASSHAEGNSTYAINYDSHSEGSVNYSLGIASHTEGTNNYGIGHYSHSEGSENKSYGNSSHTEGNRTIALGDYSHAEGQETVSNGVGSHAGGYNSHSNGDYSFVHGQGSVANGDGTIVLGDSLSGNSDNTVYVNSLNIKSVGITTPVYNLGIDVNGNVVSGSTGGEFSFIYELGEYVPSEGGVVYNRWKEGTTQKYSILAIEEFSGIGLTEWGFDGIGVIGVGSSWDGSTNTSTLVALSGTSPTYAAGVCASYTGGGKSDWYLPAVDELVAMWNSKFVVNRTLSSVPLSDLLPLTGTYWSSTQFGATASWSINMQNSDFNTPSKINAYIVRPVRVFIV